MGDAFPIPFGRYQLLERLAVGGMAELFVARVPGEHGFAKRVVIKRLLPHLRNEPGFVEMFIDEAKLTARLVHPKIVQTHELGRHEDQLYIVMEYVDGLDVLALLRACAQWRKRLKPEIAAWVVHEVLDALAYAHDLRDEHGQPLDIVHRDISPSNVLLSTRGDVKLADFGIAKTRSFDREHRTRTGTLKGKYGYMSPEQVFEESVDHRSDVFSVGVVLAEMLTGHRLFTGATDLQVLLMVRDLKLDRLDRHAPGIDPGLDQIVRRALQRSSERWRDAAAFRDALAGWMHGQGARVTDRDLAAVVATVRASIAQRNAQGLPADPGAFALLEKEPPTEPSARAPTDSPATAVAPRASASSGGMPAAGLATAMPMEVSLVAPSPLPTTARTRTWDRAMAEGSQNSQRTRTPRATGQPVTLPDRPDETGDFAETSPVRALFRLVSGRAMGMFAIVAGGSYTEIFLRDGSPEVVTSNLPGELFGNYLVAQGVLSDRELALALTSSTRYGGKLGDALIGLRLLKPADVRKHLAAQVRAKVVDVCGWPGGRFGWYRRRTSPDAVPLDLNGFEVLGAGAMALDELRVEEWIGRYRDAVPHRRSLPVVVDLNWFEIPGLEAFHERVDGRKKVGALVDQADRAEQVRAGRMLYLLACCELVVT